jgi:uncharacterized protein (DUF2164 family)
MRIKLSDEARKRLITNIQRFLGAEFELQLSEFQASGLLDFLVRELGAPVYNQAIQDARTFVQSKLDDLEGEFYEPEDRS